jgi:hypothetical protein
MSRSTRHHSTLPPPGATDSELVDWFFNKFRSIPPSEEDIRGVCLSGDLREILPKLTRISADDVKNAHDFWQFVECVFGTPIRAGMIPDVSHQYPLPDPSLTYPHYTWQWAMEDCVDLTVLSGEERDEIFASLPREMVDDLVAVELQRTVVVLDEVSRNLSDLFNKLRQYISRVESAEFGILKTKNANLSTLAGFCANTLIRTIEREQLLDSIEEVHGTEDDKIAVIVDEIEKVKCIVLETPSELINLLTERDTRIGTPQIESVHFSYPFSSVDAPKLPQIGPFCHICRQRKPDMPKCTNKLSAQFPPWSATEKTICHRRFCNDCLTVYTWPKPVEIDTAKPSTWKCPICQKLCTCDRCVRNVFLRCLKGFCQNMKLTPIADPPPAPCPGFFEIVGPFSQFSADSVFPTVTAIQTPAEPVSPPTSNRSRRGSSVSWITESLVQKRNRKSK